MDSSKYNHWWDLLAERELRNYSKILFLEKVLFLFPLISLRASDIDLLPCIWIFTRIEHNRAKGHWCRSKVLHLLKGKVEFTKHLLRKGLHISLVATRVRGDKVRDKLITQSVLATDIIKITI